MVSTLCAVSRSSSSDQARTRRVERDAEPAVRPAGDARLALVVAARPVHERRDRGGEARGVELVQDAAAQALGEQQVVLRVEPAQPAPVVGDLQRGAAGVVGRRGQVAEPQQHVADAVEDRARSTRSGPRCARRGRRARRPAAPSAPPSGRAPRGPGSCGTGARAAAGAAAAISASSCAARRPPFGRSLRVGPLPAPTDGRAGRRRGRDAPRARARVKPFGTRRKPTVRTPVADVGDGELAHLAVDGEHGRLAARRTRRRRPGR